MGRQRKAVTKDLEEGSRKFENWRRTRKKRGPAPERLWGMAIKLARKHGIYQTAKELRINYDSLKKRLNGAGEKHEPTAFQILRGLQQCCVVCYEDAVVWREDCQ